MIILPYRKLRIWDEARLLALETYRATESFPASERFGLVSQMRRAAASVMANIAEGTGRRTIAELTSFIFIARGSAKEVGCLGLLAADLGYLSRASAESLFFRYEGLIGGMSAFLKVHQQKNA